VVSGSYSLRIHVK